WDRAILTDSGGYQVFSLAERRKITEAGVHFKSHLDGSAHFLSPQRAVDIQAAPRSHIAMVLDECLSWPAAHHAARAAMELPARWARRNRDRMLALRSGDASVDHEGARLPPVPLVTPAQAQFGIVQGGTVPSLRVESADATIAIGFEGYAI